MSEEMDKLEQELGAKLKAIPGGGFGEMGAYGMHREAYAAAKVIRRMIEQAAKEKQ